MPKALKTRPSAAHFMHEHTVKYELQIMHHHSATEAMISVRCEFYTYLNHEDKGDKCVRAKTEAKMTWTNNFRIDLYQAHLKRKHPSTWNEYKISSYDDKIKFFERQMIGKNIIFY